MLIVIIMSVINVNSIMIYCNGKYHNAVSVILTSTTMLYVIKMNVIMLCV